MHGKFLKDLGRLIGKEGNYTNELRICLQHMLDQFNLKLLCFIPHQFNELDAIFLYKPDSDTRHLFTALANDEVVSMQIDTGNQNSGLFQFYKLPSAKVNEEVKSYISILVNILQEKKRISDLTIVNEKLLQQSHSDSFHRVNDEIAMVLQDMIDGLSHGLSNPVGVLLANNSIFQGIYDMYFRTGEDEKQEIIKNELINIFSKQRQAIDRISSLLVDLNRITNKDQPLHRVEINIKDAIFDGIAMCRLPYEVYANINFNIIANTRVYTSKFSIVQPIFHVIRSINELYTDPLKYRLSIDASSKSQEACTMIEISINLSDPYTPSFYHKMSLGVVNMMIHQFDGKLRVDNEEGYTIFFSMCVPNH